MSLYWLDTTVVVRRMAYVNDVGSLATVFTSVSSSVQQNDVPVDLRSAGFSSRTYTVFMDLSRTIIPEDRLVTTSGVELTVRGVKRITSGGEPYQEISCEESQG